MNIGEKIKELRKERKMTLAQVAGERISKGMLSLIENGKAQPSMESLQHIAKQLQIDVSELMQTKDNAEIRKLYLKIEPLVGQLKKEFDELIFDQKCQQIIDLIKPYIEEGELNGTVFEEIRLTEIYDLMHYYLKRNLSIDPFVEIVERYKQIHAYSQIVKGYSRIASVEFMVRHYEEAIEWLLKGESYISHYEAFVGEIEQLDLYYNLMAVYAALNNDEKSEHYLQLALEIAHEKKILYRVHDFYRYLFFINVMKEDGEKALEYLKKIEAFSIIFEDPIEVVIVELAQLIYLNNVVKDYNKVIQTTVNYLHLPTDVIKQMNQFIFGEFAYAHFQLKQFNEAMGYLKNIEGPKLHHHPLDAIRFYRSFAVRALCYLENGEIEDAKRDILYAMDGVKDFKDSIDKRLIINAYETIMH
ncbi:MAG: helix-turn-helix transcriptional regulator [Solibacillus sp.]|uniref:helix-turn-helix domain-containing protein n=1 Tax=Solibacillus sp. TaxID=1909654 RepID=UPI003316330E